MSTRQQRDLLDKQPFPTIGEWEWHIEHGGALAAVCTAPVCPVCGGTCEHPGVFAAAGAVTVHCGRCGRDVPAVEL